MNDVVWPSLPYPEWAETCETLHMFLQIAGKLKLTLCAPESHWWHVAFYVTPRGLTSGPIPYEALTFQIDFDLLDHEVRFFTSTGKSERVPLQAHTVRAFYFEVMKALERLGIDTTIDKTPKEVPNSTPFDEDDTERSYNREHVERFRTILVQSDQALRAFHAKFCGKSSPVHFFWGSFDLALTRFSGKTIQTTTADGTHISVEEEFAFGFWPGSERYPKPAFYAYALPPPLGYSKSNVQPEMAHFDEVLGEFVLDYEDVRNSTDPPATILTFAQSTYETAANLGKWDRALLERIVLEPIP